jgi:hypothetical protein
MTRSIIRRVDWTCSPEPESPRPIHAFACMECGEAGPAANDFETARGWTFVHVGRNPSHTGYREEITRYWRVTGENVVQRCQGCGGRGARILPSASAETECSDCEGTGRAVLAPSCMTCHDRGCADCGRAVPAPSSAPTRQYGAPALPLLGPVDSGAPEMAERP